MSKRSGRMFPRTGSEASLDSTGKQKSFLRTFTRFAEKTSMVGIPYINRAKFWWAKLIWSIMLLGAISAMILHLWYLFDQWYAWPKQTSVELGFNTLAFPQVTICNTNKMKRHNLEGLNDSQGWLLKELVKDMDPKNLVSHQFDSNYEPDIRNRSSSRRKRFVDGYDKLNLTKYMYHGNYTNKFELTDDDDYNGKEDKLSLVADIFMWLYMNLTSHARKDLGHQISNMLIRCTFNGRKCNASMFELRQTWKYGNCWTISNKLFQANKSGPTGGKS
ncbi:hypothetical protein DPMN_175022 [Dreissena polymorpha]|uniref:Uncharacterized protein n=1 Tax=Dreissena polymorpha TaxID=45954 RepID=A0A9D4E7E5_DREPO|nr:hypothetical protein DPMN_175022 [Dreissena polymorpha]